MYTDNIMNLIGKEVEVNAGGTTYRGRLVEVSETEVFLQGALGYMQIGIETVQEIKPYTSDWKR